MRDEPFYRDMESCLAQEAGYFDAPTYDVEDGDLRWPTPLNKVRVPDGAPDPVVLLCTGALAPVHVGHIQMMETAKTAMEAAGATVVGGFLSPGHDEYVFQKVGDKSMPAAIRLAAVAAATADSPWLTVDGWEALGCDAAVNFTTVCYRLQRYLAAKGLHQVSVVFVVGEDNARFALVKGLRTCIVPREGAQPNPMWAHVNYRERLRGMPSGGMPSVVWASSGVTASSSAVRAGRWDLVPEPAQRVLNHTRPATLVVRHETADVCAKPIHDRYAAFQQGLKGVLDQHFVVSEVSVENQRKGPLPEGNIVALDPMLSRGGHILQISRCYEMGGYVKIQDTTFFGGMVEAPGFVPRPGAESLLDQVTRIPPGEYVLVDDDSVTGGTVTAATRILETAGVHITKTHVLVDGSKGEVVDARDFLLGTQEGGLVVAISPNTVGRVPYVLPFVDPSARVSIPPMQVVQFSYNVWRLNVVCYKDSGVRIRDLPEASRGAMLACGHAEELLVERVAEYYACRLRNLLSRGYQL